MKNRIHNPLRRKSCLASALAVAFTSTLWASTLHVEKDGTDVPTCGLKRDAACLTVQYTIDNRSAAGDVILIGEGIYSELINLNKNLTLRGVHPRESTVIDGMASGTVVTVPSGVTASLESLTIRDGLVSFDFGSSFVAGGISNAGTLSLLSTVVSGNRAVGAEPSGMPVAGGILNLGSLNLSHSSVVSNVATNGCTSGGGILNYFGAVTMNDSLVADNTATLSDSCGPSSGNAPTFVEGYFNLFGSTVANTTTFRNNLIETFGGTLTLDRSTVSNSDSDGIANQGSLTVTNSTISGNAGAGINNYFVEAFGVFDMSNSTVASNSGLGVELGDEIPISSTIRNSILAGNGGDCGGSFGSGGQFISGDYNLIQSIGGCTFSGGGHDIIGVSADLRSLGHYGGPTQTMNLKADSPAINAGNPAGCKDGSGVLITVDQRGFPRPEPSGGRCDIGAVEFQKHDEF